MKAKAHPAAAIVRSADAAPAPIVIEEVAHRLLGGRKPEPPRDERKRWLELILRLRTGEGEPVDRVTVEQALRALSTATLRARSADLECFKAYCVSHMAPALPSTVQTIVGYADFLAEKGQRLTTIRRKLSSISAAHDLLNLESPARALAVRHALRAIGKERGSARRQALAVRLGKPLTTKPASSITLHALLDGCPSDPRGLRDAALLSVAYDGGLRASELIGADAENVRLSEDGSGTLYLTRSKTDQAGEGTFVFLSPETMQRLAAWLAASQIKEGPLFRRISARKGAVTPGRPARKVAKVRGPGSLQITDAPPEPELRTVRYLIASHDGTNNRRLTRPGLALIYRTAARRAADRGAIALTGEELEEAISAFSTHGFRVGLTQDLFAERLDVGQVQLALRWKSAATALGYARELNVQNNAAADLLRRRRPVRPDPILSDRDADTPAI